jgi:hypothetical protein
VFFCATTTTTAAVDILYGQTLTISTQLAKAAADKAILTNATISAGLIVAMLVCTYTIFFAGAIRVWPAVSGPASQEMLLEVERTGWDVGHG